MSRLSTRRRLRGLCLGLFVVAAAVVGTAPAGAEEPYLLKFASLAPEGSTWQNGLQAAADELREKSHGRLVVRMYAGGVAGDEKDVLRKIKIGQLHGGAFTGVGLGEVNPEVRVMELPFYFTNYAEVDYVTARMLPRFRAGFDDHGFKLLGWMEVGFIQFFSTHPIRSLEEMRRSKFWMWEGDPLAAAFFAASDIHPIPLSITEVLTSLSTHLVDTVYASPLGAIALQWASKVGYMSELPMADGVAGIIVSRRFFDRLPADLQTLLSEVMERHARALVVATRKDNDTSMRVMKERGVEVTFDRSCLKPEEVATIQGRAVASLVDHLFSRGLMEEAQRYLAEARATVSGK